MARKPALTKDNGRAAETTSICPTCGGQIRHKPLSDSDLRKTLSDSFHIFHATTSLCAILLGFVFTALTILLFQKAEELGAYYEPIAWMLTLTMLCLLFGMMHFHFTAHQVIKWWRIFWPKSKLRDRGGLVFGVGITMLLLTLAVLLYSKNRASLYVLSTIVGMSGFAHMGFVGKKSRIHSDDEPYVRDVDRGHCDDV